VAAAELVDPSKAGDGAASAAAGQGRPVADLERETFGGGRALARLLD
jgi:hypothetical protein